MGVVGAGHAHHVRIGGDGRVGLVLRRLSGRDDLAVPGAGGEEERILNAAAVVVAEEVTALRGRLRAVV